MKKKVVLYNILDILLAIIVPIVFIVIRYDLFSYKEKYSITGWGLILILIIVFVLVRRIQLWLKVANETGLKIMPISYFLPPALLFLLFAFLKIAENHMETLLELSLWGAISNSGALFFRWRAWEILDKGSTDQSEKILQAISKLEKVKNNAK